MGLASEKKHIDYATLLKELDLSDVRELEDLIIDVIYADIIRGKLDQKNKQVREERRDERRDERRNGGNLKSIRSHLTL